MCVSVPNPVKIVCTRRTAIKLQHTGLNYYPDHTLEPNTRWIGWSSSTTTLATGRWPSSLKATPPWQQVLTGCRLCGRSHVCGARPAYWLFSRNVADQITSPPVAVRRMLNSNQLVTPYHLLLYMIPDLRSSRGKSMTFEISFYPGHLEERLTGGLVACC